MFELNVGFDAAVGGWYTFVIRPEDSRGEENIMDQSRSPNASSRRKFMKHSLAATAGLASAGGLAPLTAAAPAAPTEIWVTDVKCAIMGGAPWDCTAGMPEGGVGVEV